jgi:copper homeostasis protein
VSRAAGLLEICVDDPASLRAAIDGGADRIELCSALSVGGLTPSAAFAATAAATGVPIHAMIRPRAGDFVYDHPERATMLQDIARLRDLGVAGVVIGAAAPNGELDERTLAQFREAAAGLAIVLHRVVDLTPDPIAAARIVRDLGYDAILTSGGAPTAFEGRETIARMVDAMAGALTIIACSGVTPETIAAIVRDGRVSEVHASASVAHDWRDGRIERYGFAAGPRRLTDAGRVADLRRALSKCLSKGRP